MKLWVWVFRVAALGKACHALSAPSPVRRAVLTAPLVMAPSVSQAFEGSSSYSGRTPLAAASKAKAYRDRIAADVKDFNTLGAAIERGETQGQDWVSFFIEFQRREPDPVGRTYAAQIDLVGADRSGGAALLLASTYAKPNKPPDNLPQYKKYTAMAKSLAPIAAAGKAGDAAKAKSAWMKASEALTAYLDSVDMPADLSDPLYK